MDQIWIKNYVKEYLELSRCNILDENDGQIYVKLSVDADKDLTNRPYYWTFVERTGAEAETLTLNFVFDPDKTVDDKKGELLYPGSPRLKQIFNCTKKRGQSVRLFQKPFSKYKNAMFNTASTQLTPWLGINYRVEFQCDRKKSKIVSLGINLTNGQMKNNFYPFLKTIILEPSMPANISLNSPFLTLREAAIQLEEWIMLDISKESFDWAYESNETLEAELTRIETYYSSEEYETNEKEQRIEEIKRQYSPKIDVSPINYGLFFLDQSSVEISNILN